MDLRCQYFKRITFVFQQFVLWLCQACHFYTTSQDSPNWHTHLLSFSHYKNLLFLYNLRLALGLSQWSFSSFGKKYLSLFVVSRYIVAVSNIQGCLVSLVTWNSISFSRSLIVHLSVVWEILVLHSIGTFFSFLCTT